MSSPIEDPREPVAAPGAAPAGRRVGGCTGEEGNLAGRQSHSLPYAALPAEIETGKNYFHGFDRCGLCGAGPCTRGSC